MGLGVFFISASAYGHTVMTDPQARDIAATATNSGHKGTGAAPCGGVTATTPWQYQPGQTITVKMSETIGHRGCFQVALLPNDTGGVSGTNLTGQLLAQKDDPDDGTGDRTISVTLPTTPCASCVLQMRQLMINTACAANAPADTTTTYMSCADVRIGTFTDAGPARDPNDAGTPTSSSSSSSSSSGSVIIVPGDGQSDGGSTGASGGNSAKPQYTTDDNVGQCSLTAAPAVGLLGLGTFALGLRRRRRNRGTDAR